MIPVRYVDHNGQFWDCDCMHNRGLGLPSPGLHTKLIVWLRPNVLFFLGTRLALDITLERVQITSVRMPSTQSTLPVAIRKPCISKSHSHSFSTCQDTPLATSRPPSKLMQK